ncbi:exodeoxyribonuclease V subunit gamma [Marinospirillum perlucidum]|uniref:exodeoxyribonuclease V subunit gamma n=1 Tax=Marinospirillum perlucidum TaxID=1982602 RepID=UPI000DF3E706|nr:exodeoxyribonuclease V subunit gamma [Marinospirillum perlucidum]
MLGESREELTPGMMILQGNRLEELRDLLVQWLDRHPLTPLEDEQLLVQSNGIAQWLKMALAADPAEGGSGIAAAIRVDLPGRFIWQAYRCVYPDLPTSSPYDKDPLTWRLYRLLQDFSSLQAQLDEPQVLAPLAAFLHTDADPRRLHQLAAKLADLYDQYQIYRADWLQAWEEHRDVLISARGSSEPLSAENRWQPVIWRALVASIRNDEHLGSGRWDKTSRARIHQEFLAACRGRTPEERPAGLPRRLVIFGISSLPRQTLELLEALSSFTQILLFVHNPSRHYWGDLIAGKELLRQEYRRLRERKLPSHLSPEETHLYGHPLLASWGKQGRDYLHLLDENDQPENYREHFQQIDLFVSPGESCLLHQLQEDILELRSLEEIRNRPNRQVAPEDLSLVFQQATSPLREVEILHDQLLHEREKAHQEGQPLEPRDILVMVPDIQVYTPAIQAVFGQYQRQEETADPRYLPFHISDQGQRGQNTLLIALEKLLHLPRSRFTVSELLDLLDTPALRQRFGLQEADLPRLKEWIRGANIRWGLNGEQRASLDLPAGLEENTWMQGLKRLLLGYASGSSPAWQGIEPYDEVAGLEAALVGPLALLLEELDHYRLALQEPRPPEAWRQLLEELLAAFFEETDAPDTLALNRLEQRLDELQEHWQQASFYRESLPLEVIREEWLAGIDQPNLTQKFLGGSINFATLMPMRALPFRQIWLLGMNDKDYPRSVQPADFDLMAQDYRPGDRSRREDDRYLFLEALLSARDKLVISWINRDQRDLSERQPSVLVGQLQDHLVSGWQACDSGQLLEQLTQEYPLQAFSRRYFEPGRNPRLFTYAHEWREVHHGNIQPASLDLQTRQPEGSLQLAQLSRFLRQPVQLHYQQRLGVHWQNQEEVAEDEENFQLDGLEKWQLQQRLIQQVLQARLKPDFSDPATALDQAALSLQRAGYLPLPPFADPLRETLTQELLAPLQSYLELQELFPQQLPNLRRTWELSPQLQLEADLKDVRSNASAEQIRILLQPSRLYAGDSYKWYQLVRYWPEHLFAQLAGPTTTRLLGPDTDISLAPLTAELAEKRLLELAAAWQEGWRRLLPLPCKTGFALQEENQKIREIYEGSQQIPGESQEHPAFLRFWPEYADLEANEDFHTWSHLLYRPLIEHLQEAKA